MNDDTDEPIERRPRPPAVRPEMMVGRYVPPYSVPDMERMARAVVESRLFGISSEAQAMTLMLLAQAEGRHPVLAARDYHIIEGRPSKSSEAMMRDFLAAGGQVDWHQLDDDAAEASFRHARGGEVTLRWDIARAKQAGLLGRRGDMYGKYPRAMLRSRCVSEGIRTVFPAATSGMYVPEETADIVPRRPRESRMKDVTPPPYDPETGEYHSPNAPGEVYERIEPDMAERARRMASKGTDILRGWLHDLSREDRASLRELIGTAAEPGELLLLARKADSDALIERMRHPIGAPFSEQVTPAPLTPTVDPAGIPSASAAPAGELASGEDSNRIAVPSAKGKADYRTWSKALLQPKLRLAADAADLAHLLGANEDALEACRKALDAADLKELQAAISDAWDRCPQ